MWNIAKLQKFSCFSKQGTLRLCLLLLVLVGFHTWYNDVDLTFYVSKSLARPGSLQGSFKTQPESLNVTLKSIGYSNQTGRENKQKDPAFINATVGVSLFRNNKISVESVSKNHAQVKDKIILLYNSPYGYRDWRIGTEKEPFERLHCPVQNCRIKTDHQFFHTSDAVLFHVHTLTKKSPLRSNFRQRWVFFMHESPGFSKNLAYQNWNGLFNWTMTYRLDSDIVVHYGDISKKKDFTDVVSVQKQKNILRQNFLKKKKNIAWMVTNCNTQSQRHKYVEKLRKVIDVDIYGTCGNLTCDRDWYGGDTACLSLINATYKFYLAFENSFCKDYVTEKLYRMLPLDVIPVVRGGADYKKMFPFKWFVDSADFSSPEELGHFLLTISNDSDKFMEYFLHREEYNLEGFLGSMAFKSWCTLCEVLNHTPSELKFKIHHNVSSWWRADDCYEPKDIS